MHAYLVFTCSRLLVLQIYLYRHNDNKNGTRKRRSKRQTEEEGGSHHYVILFGMCIQQSNELGWHLMLQSNFWVALENNIFELVLQNLSVTQN
jgi:hypothetical protein